MITITDDMSNDEVLEAIAKELVCRQANYYGSVPAIRKAFKHALALEHRTVQQTFMSALKLIIEDYAADRFDRHMYDGRNEFSVHWANEVQRLNEKQGHKGYEFPMI